MIFAEVKSAKMIKRTSLISPIINFSLPSLFSHIAYIIHTKLKSRFFRFLFVFLLFFASLTIPFSVTAAPYVYKHLPFCLLDCQQSPPNLNPFCNHKLMSHPLFRSIFGFYYRIFQTIDRLFS